jgi:large exoprotein involved in heme utilization and adhesion
MVNTQVGSINVNGGGALTIKTDSLLADFTSFDIETFSGPGGGISVQGRIVELTNGSPMISSTIGSGNAGDIRITATDHVSLIGDLGTNFNAPFQVSGLFSNSFGQIFGTHGGPGNAGNIVVTTPTLNMDAGRINTVTSSSGVGGNVTLNVSNGISISGEFPTDASYVPSILTNAPLKPSGITAETTGSNICGGSCGNAGNITINTGFLALGNGGQINSGTGGSGQGGNITINASGPISISGTLSNGDHVGIFSRTIGTSSDSGSGGNIALTSGQSVAISNGASVSASSTGPGNTGSIQIDAGNQFTMTNSSVTTEANQASGGIIKITTDSSGTVQLTNSTISASVLDGTGGGGSVNIDPQFVILLNSQILAQAVQGPGGNIFITTNLLLPDANSVISASSLFGVNGTVTIQSPNAPASGQIQPLGKSPLLATSLLNQRCAALAGGEFSSFIVAGRDNLPTEPGGWLASPLYAAGIGPGVKAEGMKAEGERLETPLLSLRQIAPAGFLTQAFAVEGSASCQS